MSRHNLSCSISDSASLHLVPSLSPSLESQTKKQEDKRPKLIFESRRCEHCGIITTTEDEVIIDIGINFGFRRGKCLRHYQGGMCTFVGDAGNIANHEMKGIEYMYVSHCQIGRNIIIHSCFLEKDYDFIGALKQQEKGSEEISEIMMPINRYVHRQNRKLRKEKMRHDEEHKELIQQQHSSPSPSPDNDFEFVSQTTVMELK